MLRVLDLFSGIGGFSLGLERTGGFQTVAFCEINSFCRGVLAKQWAGVPIYDDVQNLDAATLRRDGIAVDVITGGFPCQDLSWAGKRAGIEGEKSGLWSELARLIGDVRPRYAIVENVTNLLGGPSEKRGGWFGRVLGDLAAIGYDACWDCIPAASVGAPHVRDRVWIIAKPQHSDAMRQRQHRARRDVRPAELRDEQGGDIAALRAAMAHAYGAGCEGPRSAQPKGRRHHSVSTGGSSHVADANGEPMERTSVSWEERNPWETEPDFRRVVDGLPDDLDAERAAAVSAFGNAVVPRIPELIGRALLAAIAQERAA